MTADGQPLLWISSWNTAAEDALLAHTTAATRG
jgi:hypothetical protein